MSDDRPGFSQRVQRAAPKDARQNRSNAMIVLGVVLFVMRRADRQERPESDGSETPPDVHVSAYSAPG